MSILLLLFPISYLYCIILLVIQIRKWLIEARKMPFVTSVKIIVDYFLHQSVLKAFFITTTAFFMYDVTSLLLKVLSKELAKSYEPIYWVHYLSHQQHQHIGEYLYFCLVLISLLCVIKMNSNSKKFISVINFLYFLMYWVVLGVKIG